MLAFVRPNYKVGAAIPFAEFCEGTIVTSHLLDKDPKALPLWLVTEAGFKTWVKSQPKAVADWLAAAGFRGGAGKLVTLPGKGGELAGAVAGVPVELDLWSIAHLPTALPRAAWRIASPLKAGPATQLALGFVLGTYAFRRYRKADPAGFASLVWPRGADRALVQNLAASIFMVRDLVNTPAGDMGPAEMATVAEKLAS